MGNLKIGVVLTSFGLGVKESLKKAAKLGMEGVQLWNVTGELDPRNMSKTGRADFVDFVKSLGLTISALCGELGGFSENSTVEERIERTKEFLDLSVDLKAPIVTAHIGIIPENSNTKEWKLMREALKEIGRYGEKIGSCLAAETGPESPSLMRKFYEEVNSPGLKINYDPANLVINGYDPIQGVYELKDYIIHTHAKDGKRNDGEKPLGEGDVHFNEYVEALRTIGYTGFYTIEREVSHNPISDIVYAKRFLENL